MALVLRIYKVLIALFIPEICPINNPPWPSTCGPCDDNGDNFGEYGDFYWMEITNATNSSKVDFSDAVETAPPLQLPNLGPDVC